MNVFFEATRRVVWDGSLIEKGGLEVYLVRFIFN